MKIPREIKGGWGPRFPDLSGKRTHWKITGAGKFIAVVDGFDLIGALEVVQENGGRYMSIKANRASVNEHNQLNDERGSS